MMIIDCICLANPSGRPGAVPGTGRPAAQWRQKKLIMMAFQRNFSQAAAGNHHDVLNRDTVALAKKKVWQPSGLRGVNAAGGRARPEGLKSCQ